MLSFNAVHPDVHVPRDYLVPAVNSNYAVDSSSPTQLSVGRIQESGFFFFRLSFKTLSMCLYTPEKYVLYTPEKIKMWWVF